MGPVEASGINIPFSASGRPKYNDRQCDCFEFHINFIRYGRLATSKCVCMYVCMCMEFIYVSLIEGRKGL